MQGEIRKSIQNVLVDLGLTDIDFVVEHPGDMAHGDYATNVAMVCAKKLQKNPREIAENFAKALEDKTPHVLSITIAGPGFINFTLARDFF